jgi:hypothetical protein
MPSQDEKLPKKKLPKIDRDELAKRIREAVNLAVQYGQIDGAHHKAWVIDQMVRILCGEGYKDIVRVACEGPEGELDEYGWDEGIAP